MSSLRFAAPVPAPMTTYEQPFGRILLAIDFASSSLAAARWATKFIAPFSDALIAHILPLPAHLSDPANADPKQAVLFRQMTSPLTGGLGGFAATLEVASARTVVDVGRPSHRLSAMANESRVSLVVLGRRADANRIRVGEPNVTERVARRTHASVLVVPEGNTIAPSHIVAAVDESSFAPRVLEAAGRLARRLEIPLTILHVVAPIAGAYERALRSARRLLSHRRGSRSKETQTLAPPVAPRVPPWLTELAQAHSICSRHRTVVAVGDPAREITVAASAHDGALVVVGMRGADGTPRESVGSVTRELLTRAPIPILLVNAAA